MRIAAALTLALASAVSARVALAQECPASVKTIQSPSEEITGWLAFEGAQTFDLVGMSVVHGKMHAETGRRATLKPRFGAGDDYSWTFTEPVGDVEMWMVCILRDTKMRLIKRIDSKATECRVTKVESATTGGTKSVRAVCD